MTNEELQAVIVEIGPLDDAITGVARLGEDRWAVGLGDVDLEIELADGIRVVATATIAKPPRDALLPVCQALLAYSMLWRETGGVRAALPASHEPAVLLVDIALEGLTPKTLVGALRSLAEKAVVWQRLFAAAAEAGAGGQTPTFDPAAFGEHAMIRV